ncbi:MAG: ribosomal RNA small subunit methyltransferase A [Acidobacteria bacterium]|nr:ribosomal RNA small subunit methyltransferase A [Acidobacteriota bacterium]
MVSKKEPPSRRQRPGRRPASSAGHGVRRPPLGQHFLTDRRVEKRILDALGLTPEDVVLEIGGGRGNMTALLAAQAGKVIALELDPKLVVLLRRKFEMTPNVDVREADILRVQIDSVAREAEREKIKVYGNLPYYITSPCLMHLFQHHSRIAEIVVMVQEEVAQRIAAKPGSTAYGLLSLTCQYYSNPVLLFSVGPQSFSPPPKVRSAVVRMPVNPQRETLGLRPEDETAFWTLVRRAFSQKRKTLFNNLKGVVAAQRLKVAIDKANIEPQARAETMPLKQFAALFQNLNALEIEG